MGRLNAGGLAVDSLTVRDYFAAHAPGGNGWSFFEGMKPPAGEVMAQLARFNYLWADAMLAEREK
jgi:hypothetical protein